MGVLWGGREGGVKQNKIYQRNHLAETQTKGSTFTHQGWRPFTKTFFIDILRSSVVDVVERLFCAPSRFGRGEMAVAEMFKSFLFNDGKKTRLVFKFIIDLEKGEILSLFYSVQDCRSQKDWYFFQRGFYSILSQITAENCLRLSISIYTPAWRAA